MPAIGPIKAQKVPALMTGHVPSRCGTQMPCRNKLAREERVERTSGPTLRLLRREEDDVIDKSMVAKLKPGA